MMKNCMRNDAFTPKQKGLLHRVVTRDEKLTYFQNLKHKKSWVMPSNIECKAGSVWEEDTVGAVGLEWSSVLGPFPITNDPKVVRMGTKIRQNHFPA